MDQQSPGFIEAMIQRLRGTTGMTGTVDPSAAAAVRTLQQVPQGRDLQIRAAEAGMPVEQYLQMLQQQGPR